MVITQEQIQAIRMILLIVGIIAAVMWILTLLRNRRQCRMHWWTDGEKKSVSFEKWSSQISIVSFILYFLLAMFIH